MQDILFIQGGGAGTYDEWDNKLVDSLRRELGEGFEVRYPRMPDEDDPSSISGARRFCERWRRLVTVRWSWAIRSAGPS